MMRGHRAAAGAPAQPWDGATAAVWRPRCVSARGRSPATAATVTRAAGVPEAAGCWGHDGRDRVDIRQSLQPDRARGGLMRRASTITQQLAKTLYLSPSRNPLRQL